MAFRIVSPTGKEIDGYTRKDALYAAAILAEKERRFHGRQEPRVVQFSKDEDRDIKLVKSAAPKKGLY